MSNPNEMLNDWNPETASLLASLVAQGFTIWGGNNGEGEDFKRGTFATETAFLEELLACDEALLYVTRNGTKESTKTPGKQVKRVYSLYLVLGNSPGELVSDWGIPADEGDAKALEQACKECSDKWDGKPQPLIRASVKYPDRGNESPDYR
jgi:hypothetical protein